MKKAQANMAAAGGGMNNVMGGIAEAEGFRRMLAELRDGPVTVARGEDAAALE